MVRRDGTVLAHMGGTGVKELHSRAANGDFKPRWSEATGALLKRMVRRSIASRITVDARFEECGRALEARVTPNGPDRAIVVVRAVDGETRPPAFDDTGAHDQRLDRRGFVRRLRDLLATATLREQPLAAAILLIEGIPDIAQIIASRVSEQLMNLALLRLTARLGDGSEAQPRWHLGQIGENTLGIVIETGDRSAIENCLAGICSSLREPIVAGDSEFQLRPYVGVELLQLDTHTSSQKLLEHARIAADEARQTSSQLLFFYSDEMQGRSLARLDMGRELREAIAHGQIGFRYFDRYELRSHSLVSRVGYLRWHHPLRGELGAHDFLRLAGSTGLALTLSRAALHLMCTQASAAAERWPPGLRVSFAPLRDHLFHEDFIADVEQLLFENIIAGERLELRIAEKMFAARDLRHLRALQRRGVQLIVDQSGSANTSLAALARTPVAGLQLDRKLVTALSVDSVARQVCQATISVARSLGMSSIAPGIDTQGTLDALVAIGCTHGSGALFETNPG